MKKIEEKNNFWQKYGYRIASYAAVLLLGLILCVFMVKTVSDSKITVVAMEEPIDTIPELHLALNGTDLATVNAGLKSTKYPGNDLYIKNGEEVVYDFSGNVELKGRGNSTWSQIKKPYQIKFDKKTDLFNLGASKKWVLLADFLDPTHLRNDISNYLARMLDMEFTRDGRFVNLYVDEEYIGFYYLTHKVEIGSATVNLENNLGILLEMENLHDDPEDEIAFVSLGNQNTFIISETVSEDEILIDTAVKLFERDYNLFEKAVLEQDYEKITELVDVESFAKYFLISEFSINPDAFASSFYFYKDGPDDKIHAGPIWDFDLAFSNQKWGYENEESCSPTASLSSIKSYYGRSSIIQDLLLIPDFATLVGAIFEEKMSDHLEDLLKYFDSRVALIHDVATKDDEKWGTGDFDDEATYLRNWLVERYVYFKETYGAH